MKKRPVVTKMVTLDKKIYTDYIQVYMDKKKLRSLSIAIEQMAIELEDGVTL